MDEFLKIVGMNHIVNSGTFEELQPETEQFKEALKKYVSESIYDELVELLNDAITATNEYAFVEGMKTAIAITEKKYSPVL
jgi:phage tail tape-measure protein